MEHNHCIMKNIKFRFLNSLFAIPFITGSLLANPVVGMQGLLLNSKEMIFDFRNKDQLLEVKTQDERAKKIDIYFSKYDLPLAGFGEKMIQEADLHNLDWRLIPAIAMRESTGGKFACKNANYNPFGWGSCKIGFDSYDHSIEVLARNLSGNNPKTQHYYKDKDIRGILETYNPPNIVPKYADQVMKIMLEIENTIEDITA